MLYMHLSLPPYCTQKIMFGSEWVLLMVVCVLELHGASKNCDIGKYMYSCSQLSPLKMRRFTNILFSIDYIHTFR